jgi:hypothetical protein
VNKFIVCYRAGGLFTTREKKFLWHLSPRPRETENFCFG